MINNALHLAARANAINIHLENPCVMDGRAMSDRYLKNNEDAEEATHLWKLTRFHVRGVLILN